MVKKLKGSKVEFKVVVSWDNWKKYLAQAVKEISEEIKIQGFRSGKAPRNLVEQKVGKGMILNSAAEKAVQKSYADFVIAEKLEAIGRPEVSIEEITEGKDFEYKAIVAVMPEVGIKEKYKKEIQKINEAYKSKSVEAGDDEIKLELEKLANSRVKLVTVLREARKNDSVEIDFSVLVDGVPIEGGTSKNHPMIIGRGVFIPGFEENLIGMKEKEEKEFELEFPKDYHKKDLAGKKAVFKVKINLVQERQTPEINDDFAKSLGTFENLDALKKNMKEGMEHENEHKMKEQKRIDIVEKIIEHMEAELPDVLIDRELRQMMLEFEQQLQPGGMSLDDYLLKIKKEKTELENDWKPQAEKRVKSALGLKEIAKLEEISADSKDIEEEMNKTLQYYKKVKDLEKNIDMERLYEYTKGTIENEKTFDFLEKI